MKKALASRRFFPDVLGPGWASDGWWRWWKGFFKEELDTILSLRLEWFDGRDFFFQVIFTFDDRFYYLKTLKSSRKSYKKKLRALSSRQTCGFQKAREIQHLEWFGNSQLVQDFRHEQSGNKKKARGVYIHQDYWQLLVIIVLLFSACAFQSHLCHYVPDALPPLKLYIAPQNWWLEGNPFVVLFWFTNAAPSLDLFPATSTTVEAM